jgi:hypothetical protein
MAELPLKGAYQSTNLLSLAFGFQLEIDEKKLRTRRKWDAKLIAEFGHQSSNGWDSEPFEVAEVESTVTVSSLLEIYIRESCQKTSDSWVFSDHPIEQRFFH